MLGYLSTKDVTALLSVDPKTIYNYRKEQDFPEPIKFGNKNLYDETQVKAWIRKELTSKSIGSELT